DYSDKVLQYREKLQEFMDAEIDPREGDVHDFVRDPDNLWKVPPCFAPLKEKAKAAGIWNWFLPTYALTRRGVAVARGAGAVPKRVSA
ncbi:MAG: hypothetical protein OSB60_17190, partial [Myxococcota bacterium]|nr:hypothetical protein [Myxococcota bacterium]